MQETSSNNHSFFKKYFYRIPYCVSFLLSIFLPLFYKKKEEVDMVVVIPERAWIMEGVANEIKRYLPGTVKFHYDFRNLPPAKSYFFTHYGVFPAALIWNPCLWKKKSFVHYSHPRDIAYRSSKELFYALNKGTWVLTPNSTNKELLISNKVDSNRVILMVGYADSQVFCPNEKKVGEKPCVGFSLGFKSEPHYYERKNYGLIIDIIKSADDIDFMILGKDWKTYERFSEVEELTNFKYMEVDYNEYPKYYNQMDVFLSVSILEGGPIPLIEAMMCDVFPVVTDTGFAKDIIQNEVNGLLFDPSLTEEKVIDLVRKALSIKKSVRYSVENMSWKNYVEKIDELAKQR